MKAISLWQPWASLMASGLKRIETRSWSTKYRGPLAIHAALKFSLDQHAAWRGFKLAGIIDLLAIESFIDLPIGGIIATVNLLDCIQITDRNCPSEPELSFGDYTPGRFMWVTENVKPFKKIIPFRGWQGLFNIPDEALRVCRVCGCSEANACEGGCCWVEEDLCSACIK